MKKLLLLLLLIPTLTFSQGIGDSYYDAMKALTNDKSYKNVEFENKNENSYNSISAETDFASLIYYFPKEGEWMRRCAAIAFIPKSRGNVFSFIEYLNKTYVIIDDKNWDFYRQDGIVVRVELKTVDELLVFYYYPKQ